MDHQLSTILARVTGISPSSLRISLRQPLDHQSNRLYDGWAGQRHLILKEYLKPDEIRDAPVREYRALELLATLDIAPRPVLLYLEPNASHGPVVVYDYLEGEMWARQRPEAATLALLAQAWLRMHAVEASGLWLAHGGEAPIDVAWPRLEARLQAYIAWAETRPQQQEIARLCATALAQCGVAARALKDHRPLLCFCRADARFANIICRPDARLGFVDWEDSGLRDPACDVVDLLTHPNQEDLLASEEWQAFLQPYMAVRAAIDPQLPQRVHLYSALFPIFWLSTLLGRGMRLAESGQLEMWTINGLPANVRLQRYLARALAWPEADFTTRLALLSNLDFFREQ